MKGIQANSYIVLENDGEIERECFETFGVSVKNEGSIGYFGTGLKYAIAITLRYGGEFVILSGAKRYKFGVQTKRIKDKDFNIVTCNEKPLGFTTDVGKNWQPWMALRELISNCKDEKGDHYTTSTIPEGQVGKTKIIINSIELLDVYERELETIFISTTPIACSQFADIHESPPRVYYKGVLVRDDEAHFGYSLNQQVTLTEDRTIKWGFEADGLIAKAWAACEDEALVRRFFNSDDRSFERGLTFSESDTFSEAFLRVAREVYKNSPDKLNVSLIKIVNINHADTTRVELSPTQEKRLEKAQLFLSGIGFSVDDYQVIVVQTLGDKILAMALPERNQIILSKRAIDQGTKQLAATLLEEVIHLREGLQDCTRNLQTYLFDLVVSFAEEVRGECL